MADQPIGWTETVARANARPHQPIPEMTTGGDVWISCKCQRWPRRMLHQVGRGDLMSLATALHEHREHARQELTRAATDE